MNDEFGCITCGTPLSQSAVEYTLEDSEFDGIKCSYCGATYEIIPARNHNGEIIYQADRQISWLVNPLTPGTIPVKAKLKRIIKQAKSPSDLLRKLANIHKFF